MNSRSSSRCGLAPSSRGPWSFRTAHFFGAAAFWSLWVLALALVEMIPVAAQTQVVTSDDLVYSMENSIELKNTGLVAAKPTKKLADGAMKLRVRDSKNKLICNSNWAVLNRESATSTWVEVRLTSANQLCR